MGYRTDVVSACPARWGWKLTAASRTTRIHPLSRMNRIEIGPSLARIDRRTWRPHSPFPDECGQPFIVTVIPACKQACPIRPPDGISTLPGICCRTVEAGLPQPVKAVVPRRSVRHRSRSAPPRAKTVLHLRDATTAPEHESAGWRPGFASGFASRVSPKRVSGRPVRIPPCSRFNSGRHHHQPRIGHGLQQPRVRGDAEAACKRLAR